MNFKISILSIDKTLTGTTILGQSGPGSNGNERLLHTPQISRTGASSSDNVSYHTQDTHFWGGWVLPFYRGYSQHTLSPADRVFFLERENRF